MKVPYQYRGIMLLVLFIVVLPWVVWHFALHNTFITWRDCRYLARKLEVAESLPSKYQKPIKDYTNIPELILSGRLLDSLRRYISDRDVKVVGYEPQITEKQGSLELHVARITLDGNFKDLLRMTYTLESMPFCRLRSMGWTVYTDHRRKQKFLTLIIYVEPLLSGEILP